MTPVEHQSFADAQIADYADWLLQHGGATSPLSAHAQARAEIEDDPAAAALSGDLFWMASTADNLTVGWLWVKRHVPGLPSATAFLYQIQVVSEQRRRGFGRAMLAALELELAARGFHALRLNVWHSNAPAHRLYQGAGFQLIEQLAGKRQLGKHLPSNPAELRP